MHISKHFLSATQLNRQQILHLIQMAQAWVDSENKLLPPATPLLKNKIIANLFFENSTRTRCSFEIAAQKLGAYALHFNCDTSSAQKGETVLDTVENLQAMGVDLLVIRHHQAGLPARLAEQMGNRVAIINAGDGSNEHPTQAMLDALTIYRHKPDFTRLAVAIIGDIRHSRVARSLYFVLTALGVTDIRFVGPRALLPEDAAFYPRASFHQQLINGIANADVVVTLRVQHERIDKATTALDLSDYIQHYCLTADKLSYAKPDAIIMHPGPINRGVEIASAVADGPQSVILKQPTLGVAMRMAIMAHLSQTDSINPQTATS